MRMRKTPLVFLAGVALLGAIALQSFAQSASASDKFAGTWRWMFNGKSFATLILTPGDAGFSGSLTGTHIELNDDGSLRVAEPNDAPSPSPIKKASLEGSDLRITIMDGDDPMEWIMTMKDDTHAEIRWAGTGGPAMKPISLEKAQ